MKRSFFIAVTLLLSLVCLQAQNNQTKTQTQQQVIDLTQYGVRIQPDKRLIIMMAALEVAGFNPTPNCEEASVKSSLELACKFRAQVRKDLANVDPDLQRRMREFFERSNKAFSTSTPAEQASRYISLAYAMEQPPTLASPPRSEDLPDEVLEILDFAPLVREFYNRTDIDELLPQYFKIYQTEGDRLREPTDWMVRSLLGYLQMRPQLAIVERVAVKNPDGKNKKKLVKYETREHPREFFIIPDLLGAPGTLNFRVIGDNYYAIVPANTNPTNSELRRAYLQFMVDPIILKYNKDIALRRLDVRRLIETRLQAGGVASADVFVTVTRSLVAAIDARQQESSQIISLTNQARALLDKTQDQAKRTAITKELAKKKAEIADESILQLCESYERGALLAFYFADKLKEVESAGFEFSSFFPDMMASLNVATEMNRLADNKVARERAAKAREARRTALAAAEKEENDPSKQRRAALLKSLTEVENLILIKNYEQAETQLKNLLREYQGEPRIFYALGRVASLSAVGITDSVVIEERLNKALTNYKFAIEAPTSDSEPGIKSRAYVNMARVLEFFERTEEAIKAYDAAIAIGDVDGGAYQDALAGKKKLTPKN
jgi:tetratricopeptide (TPR) repeat protein